VALVLDRLEPFPGRERKEEAVEAIRVAGERVQRRIVGREDDRRAADPRDRVDEAVLVSERIRHRHRLRVA
jgi:hypothetical protein